MNSENRGYTCCFFGHRKINETYELTDNLKNTIETLIKDKGVNTFLFGSKSEFDSLCLKIVTELKEKYSHIKRVYVRSAFPVIDNSYKDYLLESYEETYFPENIKGAGKASYIKRNQEMINKSGICVVYYDENYKPPKKSRAGFSDYQPRSGTQVAYDYALKKKCEIINMFTM